MATLFLVRHGQASFGAANYDCLSDLGRQQAGWLGEYFAGRELRFTRVLSGTLVRQQDTARAILESMAHVGAPLETHAGLDEYQAEPLYVAHTGGADPRAQQAADYRGYWRTFKQAMHAWSEGRLAGVPESWDSFGERTGAALAAAAAGLSRDDVVLVVSSGGAICRALAQVLECPGRTAIELNLQLRNSAFCELITGTQGMRMLSFNAIPHLDRPDRRGAITYA